MSRSNKTIAIVGLGLIGGSLAGALMDFEGAHILGSSAGRRQRTTPWPTASSTKSPWTRRRGWPGRM